MQKFARLTAAVALAAVCITTAHAQLVLEPRRETVKFGDLDTVNAQGAEVLFSRLKTAAAHVCRDLDMGHGFPISRAHADCLNAALAKGIADVRRPQLTAYAASRGVVPAGGEITIASAR